MYLQINRINPGKESTIGALYINGVFGCFAPEDAHRAVKIPGETCIPSGLYELALRNEGRLTEKYRQRYPDIHKGMLWIKDVPGFEWIYLHTGNKKDHTDGCPLVGDTLNNNQVADGFLGSSRSAYERIYPGIAAAILSGEGATIKIKSA